MSKLKDIKVRDCRQSVLNFAVEMERKLRINESKGGWENDTPSSLCKRIAEEREELKIEIGKLMHLEATSDLSIASAGKGLMAYAKVQEEAADVGNFAMMIHDLIHIKRGGPNVQIDKSEMMRPSEGIHGFADWLATKGTTSSLIPKEIVQRFIEANGLQDPRKAYQKHIKFPE